MTKKFVQRPDEIRRNSDGTLDEVVVYSCDFHLEQMDDREWWMGLTRGDRQLSLYISCTSRGRLSITVNEDGLGCHDHVTDQIAGAQAP